MGRRGNNEGSVYKRKDGRWCAAVTTGYDPDTGEPDRAYFYGKTKTGVVKQLDEAKAKIKAGIYVKPTKQTVGEWLDTWLETYVAPSVRPKTWEGHEYRIRVHLHSALGQIELRSLQTSQVQRMMNDKIKTGLSPRTVELMLITLKLALKQAVVEGLVTRNVAEYTKRPKPNRKEIRVLAVDEMNMLMAAAAKDRIGTIFLVMLGTGLRMGEALALSWKYVDLRKRELTVVKGVVTTKTPDSKKRQTLLQDPKTDKGKRDIPIPDNLVPVLRAWRLRQIRERLKSGPEYKNSGRVFTSSVGTPLIQRNTGRKLAELASKCNIPHVNPHALRHTFATRLLEKGVHPKVVQELLGHADITLTLNTYSHVMPDIKQAAARAINESLPQLRGRFKLLRYTN